MPTFALLTMLCIVKTPVANTDNHMYTGYTVANTFNYMDHGDTVANTKYRLGTFNSKSFSGKVLL